MQARTGDWLVIEQARIDREPRMGLISDVHSADGSPPYEVRWADTGRTALVFPGPDAHVVSQAELAESNARRQRRIARFQAHVTTPSRDADRDWTDW